MHKHQYELRQRHQSVHGYVGCPATLTIKNVGERIYRVGEDGNDSDKSIVRLFGVAD